jgi:hypothetical protein
MEVAEPREETEGGPCSSMPCGETEGGPSSASPEEDAAVAEEDAQFEEDAQELHFGNDVDFCDAVDAQDSEGFISVLEEAIPDAEALGSVSAGSVRFRLEPCPSWNPAHLGTLPIL